MKDHEIRELANTLCKNCRTITTCIEQGCGQGITFIMPEAGQTAGVAIPCGYCEVDERKAFEAWASSDVIYNIEAKTKSDAAYRDMPTNVAWTAWQARAALSIPAANAGQAGATVAAEPIYQVQYVGEYASSIWHDATEAAYHKFKPERRRIVCAAPASPTAAQVGAESDMTTAQCPTCKGTTRTFSRPDAAFVACDECDGQGRVFVSRKDMAALATPSHPAIGTASLPPFSVSRFSDTKQRGVLVIFDRRLSDDEIAHIDARLSAAPATKHTIDRNVIRDVFMRHGFTIKDGQTDLKPYVYEAAEALLNLATQAADTDARDEPDMLWLADDNEVFANGPDDFASDYAANCLRVGEEAEVSVDCATRASKRIMRIAVIPKGNDDDAEVVWKWIDRAAMSAMVSEADGSGKGGAA